MNVLGLEIVGCNSWCEKSMNGDWENVWKIWWSHSEEYCCLEKPYYQFQAPSIVPNNRCEWQMNGQEETLHWQKLQC